MRRRNRRNEKGLVFWILLFCLLCGGCGGRGAKEQGASEALSEGETGSVSGTEQESGEILAEERRSLTIPKTKEEEEELFGKTTPAGRWIPPEGSYRAPDGNIYNREGVVIGQWRKPTQKEIGNAVG